MNKDPLVSIIIPSYNSAKFVSEAVDSALAQTYPKIEIIIVDDGSSDNTKEVIAKYGDKINYIYQANKGLAGARNTGIAAAAGEFVALLDADDIFLPEKIAKQVEFLKSHPGCDISYSDLYHFWDDRPQELLELGYKYYSGDEVLPRLIERDFIAPLTMLIRKSVFERFGVFDEQFRRSEDLEFLVRILKQGARICFLSERLAKLRLRRTDNLQGFGSQPEVKRTGLMIFEALNREVSETERKRLNLLHNLVRYRFKTGLAYLENGDKRNARGYITTAFKSLRWGKIWGWLFWFPLALIPAGLLAAVLRAYHVRRQRSLLKRK